VQGKSYEESLHKLKLCSLEVRKNRQDLSEVFKICKGFSRITLMIYSKSMIDACGTVENIVSVETLHRTNRRKYVIHGIKNHWKMANTIQ